MFSMQPRSPSTTASAPAASTCPHLLSASRAEISPYFTENAPPKPQQVSRLGHLLEHEAGNPGQQLARLALDAHLAQPRAAVVVGHRPGERAGHAVELEHAGQELRELVGARGERLRARLHRRVAGEQLLVVRADHAAARAGGRDEVVAALELADDLARDRDRVAAVAGVVGGLAAAGLGGRHVDLGPAGFEQLDGCEPDRGPHQVDETGDEETDAHQALPPAVDGSTHRRPPGTRGQRV